MRIRTLLLGTVAGGMMMTAAQAADVDAKGAADMQKAILSILPEKAAASGFVEVTPEKDHYRFAIDFGKLVRAFVPAGELDLSAVYDGLLFPAAGPDGLVQLRRDPSDMNISARWDKAGEKGNLSYLFRDVTFDGQYDPALYYFRSFVMHGSGGSFKSDSGPQKLDGSFGPFDQTVNAARNGDGSVDIGMTGRATGFRESVKDDKGISVVIGGETANVDASFKALKTTEIYQIFQFFSTHASKEKLETEEKKELAGLVSKALPLFGSIDETLSASNITVEAQGVRVKIGKVDYRIGMDGIRDGAEIRFGFSIANPDISGVPQMMLYGDLMPRDISLSIAVPGLNFASPTRAFLEQADFSKAEPLTKEQSDAIGKLFLADGRVTVAVPEFSARSGLYDVSAKGTISTDVQVDPPKATADFDVTARDIDKTIKGIQELGQKIPELNSASFVLMMAKGMAKTEADGSAHWKVEVSDDGTVKVNGQVMPR